MGRYGDPVNPNGDLAAMREIYLCLRPGGILLLAVPTCKEDLLVYPNHRFYGPERLKLLVEAANFTVRARVWDGKSVEGGLESAPQAEPALYGPDCHESKWAWQYQPVLVLERPGV